MSAINYNDRGITVLQDRNVINAAGPFGCLQYNLEKGTAAFYKTGKNEQVLKGIYAEIKLNGQMIKTNSLRRDENCVSILPITNRFGDGLQLTIRNAGNDFAVLQNYYIYSNRCYLLLDTILETKSGDKDQVSTNYLAVIKTDDAISLKPLLESQTTDERFLFVPFDNDEFVRYDSKKLPVKAESYEVTAIFDNNSRKGFVTGSVTHDTWKTGIRINSTAGFEVFGGITSFETRDTEDSETNKEVQPHGMVFGTEIKSPKIFFGFYDDWRDGMEEYAKANGNFAPPLLWKHGPPFGWNSWSAVAFELDYDIYTGASDYVKNSLPSFNNGKNLNYINFDAVSKVDHEQKKQGAVHVKANSQNPGTYHTPFTCWYKEEQETRDNGPGGQDKYKWIDLILKDSSGKPLRYMHGKGWALDPTHPGVVDMNTRTIKSIMESGFKYVKLDFLSHGAMEGVYYDKNITTGVQAYNYGMSKLVEAVGDGIKNEEFFISLSIAPIFPTQYAHGRRISCDVFGEIGWSEYMLNSLTYGWWLHRDVYPYNDPDHICLYTSFNREKEKGPILFNEGLSRYTAAAITGGFMIDSDDFRDPGAAQRGMQILNNIEINALAASGRTFRPIEGNTDNKAADLFIRDDRKIDGCFYVAVFNLSDAESKTFNIDFERIGLTKTENYSVRDLVSGRDLESVQGCWTIELGIAEPKIFKLIKK